MEIKEKTYIEIYLNDKQMFKGIVEDVRLSGEFGLHYLPQGYYHKTGWKWTDKIIPSCIINYYAIEDEVEIGLFNTESLVSLVEEANKETKNGGFFDLNEGNCSEKL